MQSPAIILLCGCITATCSSAEFTFADSCMNGNVHSASDEHRFCARQVACSAGFKPVYLAMGVKATWRESLGTRLSPGNAM